MFTTMQSLKLLSNRTKTNLLKDLPDLARYILEFLDYRSINLGIVWKMAILFRRSVELRIDNKSRPKMCASLIMINGTPHLT
jgi:hypothetical protein